MGKKVKCRIGHKKSVNKIKFGSPWNGFSRFKGDTPIILEPNREREKTKIREGKKTVKKEKGKKQKPSTYIQPCNTKCKTYFNLATH
jgi:hypothetical protein